MRHLRMDYDGISDAGQTTSIAADEPVFVLRAKDLAAPGAVEAWSRLAEAYGADPMMTGRVRAWAREMRDWQASNISQVPDVPEGALR